MKTFESFYFKKISKPEKINKIDPNQLDFAQFFTVKIKKTQNSKGLLGRNLLILPFHAHAHLFHVKFSKRDLNKFPILSLFLRLKGF